MKCHVLRRRQVSGFSDIENTVRSFLSDGFLGRRERHYWGRAKYASPHLRNVGDILGGSLVARELRRATRRYVQGKRRVAGYTYSRMDGVTDGYLDWTDIQQGGLGDCVVLASSFLYEYKVNDNGTSTFYISGDPYTVDHAVPDFGGNNLETKLLEKAFAFNLEDNWGAKNGYTRLNAGFSASAVPSVMEDIWNRPFQIHPVASGQLLPQVSGVMVYAANQTAPGLVDYHAYRVNGTLLENPWGYRDYQTDGTIPANGWLFY